MALNLAHDTDPASSTNSLVQNFQTSGHKINRKFTSERLDLGRTKHPFSQSESQDLTYIPALRDTPFGFQYQPLNSESNEIRLLEVWRIEPTDGEDCRVACRLFHANLVSTSSYHALSYRWGDGISTRKICINSWSVSVTENLEAALWNLTYWRSPLILWADALCINQNDIDERNEQVRKMRSIYASALVVDVWIDGDEGFCNAFTLVRDFLQCNGHKPSIFAIFRDPARVDQFQSLIKFYRHNYWDRIWVVQEIAVARKVIVHCTGTNIGLSDLLALCKLFNDESLETYGLAESNPNLDGSVSLLYGPDKLGLPLKWLPPPDLYEMCQRQLSKASTDPRDQVYALIGLTKAKGNPLVAPDYSIPTSQVFINATKYILMECKNLDIIHLQPREHDDIGLPTWVPNFALGRTGLMQPLKGYEGTDLPYQASSMRSVRCTVRNDNSLFVRGFTLDTIKHLSNNYTRTRPYELDATLQQFNAWRTLLYQVKGDERLALCRTLTCGSINKLEGPSLLKGFAKLTEARFPHLSDAQLRFFATFNTSESRWWMKSWIDTVGVVAYKHNFFISKRGIVGLGPDTIQVEDKVCILLGCSLPVILRRVGDHYVYLGEAYADEYMHGKGIGELEEGLHVLEDFKLK